MKKVLMAVVAVAVVAMAGVAMAASDTATVNVSATVAKNCKFTTAGATGSVVFGEIDPASGVEVPGVVEQPVFWCSKGTSYTIVGNSPNKTGTQYRMISGTGEYIPYDFTFTATGTGAGAAVANHKTMDIGAKILSDTYNDSTPGSYSDVVTLSFSF